ncbi:hypothetical protein CLU79DRAFT_449857 [Phycomyces nitens]|nr:hypothetical protein CLU79DRAFT_449857 [Phycomyces nitens]
MSRQFGSGSVRSYQNLHNRNALLDGGFRSSYQQDEANRDSSGQNGRSTKIKIDDGDLEYMESQNDDRITGLSAKVQLLKNITGKIGDEIRSGNTLLDTMNDQFSSTGSYLGKTMSGFKKMAAKESGVTTCYLILFIVLVVIVFYYSFFR